MLSTVEPTHGCIDNLDLQDDHNASNVTERINLNGQGKVFFKESIIGKISVKFGKTRGCKVFVGRNFKGSVSVDFHGNDSIVYIGDNCTLNGVSVRSIYTGKNSIFIGNNVTTTGNCTFFSGDGVGGGGTAAPALVIGDDCMFAWNVTIRNTDSHPIYTRVLHKFSRYSSAKM